MQDLSYISTVIRQEIVRTYQARMMSSLPDEIVFPSVEELEQKLFGCPALRRLIDESIKDADSQVDLERFAQHSDGWYNYIVGRLPKFEDLDTYCVEHPVENLNPIVKKKVKDYIKDLEGYQQFRDKVDDILVHFDFEKVHKVMVALNWKWALLEDGPRVPETWEIKEEALKQLLDAVTKFGGSTGAGGFKVNCFVYDPVDEDGVPFNDKDDFENQVHLSLSFNVESWGEC